MAKVGTGAFRQPSALRQPSMAVLNANSEDRKSMVTIREIYCLGKTPHLVKMAFLMCLYL